MRLLRMTLENWRGVAAREIEFSETVTLIEGPNEVGKTTLIEALQLLFRELHSSKRKTVKAVQPAGQDIGSRVAVELQLGPQRLVYAKTFNKAPQTTLHVLEPQTAQLTGREAHEQVQTWLAEHMDLALWDALLVDQGDKIGLANLQESSGLAEALDDAAGQTRDQTADASAEQNLFAAVQGEYEKYYSPKNSKPRYGEQQQAVAEAQQALATASAALTAIENDLDQERALSRDMLRLGELLPKLRSDLQEHNAAWQAVQTQRQQLAGAQKDLLAAQTIAADAARAQQERTDLQAAISKGIEAEHAAQAQQAPLEAEVAKLAQQLDSAAETIANQKQQLAQARTARARSEADAHYLQQLETLGDKRKTQQQLEQTARSLKEQLQISSRILVDAPALRRLQDADRELDVARRARDTAATRVSVTPLTALELELNGETMSGEPGKAIEQVTATALQINLPQVAKVHIAPPQTAVELDEQAASAETAVNSLLSSLQVEDLPTAIAQSERRADALVRIRDLKAQEQALLGSGSAVELAQAIEDLQLRCDEYLAARDAPSLGAREPLIEDQAEVAALASAAAGAVNNAEQQLEQSREREAQWRRRHTELDGQLRGAQQQLAGIRAALADRRSNLEASRAQRSDDDLQQAVQSSSVSVSELAARIEGLEQQLSAANADAAQNLRDNAEAVLQRAEQDAGQVQQRLAVQTDRLQQARANGLHESFEQAQRRSDEAQEALAAVEQRAAAAKKLWEALHRHRAAARERYVAPLKDAIERLGQLVFGGSFAVEIGEDWSIASRTLHGTTLAYDDLSVGTREQLAVLLRLAAAQIVARRGGVPLLLDDALGFSDPDRLATMGAAIAAAGKTCQIIILSCAPGRFTHVGNAKVIRLQAS